MRSRESLVVLLLGVAGCTAGSSVTVDASGEGGETVITSPGNPPVVAIGDEGGVHGPPTPTPHPITPSQPLETPVPTRSPRPR
jgi:hypothetical protein